MVKGSCSINHSTGMYVNTAAVHIFKNGIVSTDGTAGINIKSIPSAISRYYGFVAHSSQSGKSPAVVYGY